MQKTINHKLLKKWRMAISEDNFLECEKLIGEMGATDIVDWRDEFGATALQNAFDQKADKCIKAWFPLKWDWQSVDFRQRTALASAVRAENPLWEELYSKTNPDTSDILVKNALSEVFLLQDDQKIAVKAIEFGWDPSKWLDDYTKENALHIAAKKNWGEFIKTVSKDDWVKPAIVGKNMWGGNPLMSAARLGSLLAVQSLIEAMVSNGKAADMISLDKAGFDPLSSSLWNGHLDVAKALVGVGVDLSSPLGGERSKPSVGFASLGAYDFDLSDKSSWTAWNVALTQENEEIRDWALSSKKWPKAEGIMTWQKVIAMRINSVEKLQSLHSDKFHRKGWNKSWQENHFKKRTRVPSSGINVALLHNSLDVVKWWDSVGSPLVGSPFQAVANSKIEQFNKISYLAKTHKRTWISSKKIKADEPNFDMSKAPGTIEKIAAKVSIESLTEISTNIQWNDEDWAYGWMSAMKNGTEKHWKWFAANMPESAKAVTSDLAKKSGFISFNLFSSLTVKKVAVLKEMDCWRDVLTLIYGVRKNKHEFAEVSKMWAKHADAHPKAAIEWWKELKTLIVETKKEARDVTQFEDLSLECLNAVLKNPNANWSLAEHISASVNYDHDTGNTKNKKLVAPWCTWITYGKLKHLEKAKGLGWFDKGHAINNVKKSEHSWCPGGFGKDMVSWVAAQAWKAWSNPKVKDVVESKTKKTTDDSDARYIADWLVENASSFKWKYINSIVYKDDELVTPRSNPLQWKLDNWQWILANPELLSLKDAPLRPLEWLWLGCGAGFLGDVAIHKRLIKETGVGIWEKDKDGRSLGVDWLSVSDKMLPKRVEKLIKAESEEVIDKVWADKPGSYHPWYLALRRATSNRGTIQDWELVSKKLHSPLEWLEKTQAKGLLQDHLNTYYKERHYGELDTSSPLTLWNAWGDKVLDMKVNSSRMIIDSSGAEVKESYEIPAWWIFAESEKHDKWWSSMKPTWSKDGKDAYAFIDFAMDSAKMKHKQYTWKNALLSDFSAKDLFAGNDMWDGLEKLGFSVPDADLAAQKVEAVGEWKAWWDRKRLLNMHARILPPVVKNNVL